MDNYSKVERDNDYTIQIGDIIEIQTALGKSAYEVHRVTKKYAFVRYNEIAEGKFTRVFSWFGFYELPKRKWETRNFQVYRKDE